MRHDPREYLANRRVSISSGCIFGTPAPLPPLEKQWVAKEEVRVRKRRSAAWIAAHTASMKAYQARRRTG